MIHYINIMFYVIITIIIISGTVYGVWRRYHRDYDNLLDTDTFEFTEEDRENNSII